MLLFPLLFFPHKTRKLLLFLLFFFLYYLLFLFFLHLSLKHTIIFLPGISVPVSHSLSATKAPPPPPPSGEYYQRSPGQRGTQKGHFLSPCSSTLRTFLRQVTQGEEEGDWKCPSGLRDETGGKGGRSGGKREGNNWAVILNGCSRKILLWG